MELLAFLAKDCRRRSISDIVLLSIAITISGKIAALTEWFLQLRQHRVNLNFILLDKEQSKSSCKSCLVSRQNSTLMMVHEKSSREETWKQKRSRL
jgi:hypothetical protein